MIFDTKNVSDETAEKVSKHIEERRRRGLPEHFCTHAVALSHVQGKPLVKTSRDAAPEYQIEIKGQADLLNLWVRGEKLCLGYIGKFDKLSLTDIELWLAKSKRWLPTPGRKYVSVNIFGTTLELSVEDLSTALRKIKEEKEKTK